MPNIPVWAQLGVIPLGGIVVLVLIGLWGWMYSRGPKTDKRDQHGD